MGPYDDRRGTLDPGLTAIVLRARRDSSGRYPFLDGAMRPRRWWFLGAGLVAGLAVWRRRGRAPAAPPTRPES